MKIVIEIPEHVYEHAKNMSEDSNDEYDAMRAIAKGKKEESQWIPCSERLPEEDGKYMVCWCGDWGVDICFAEYSKFGKYWYARYGSEYRGITAWMPLPEPYKREGGTNE